MKKSELRKLIRDEIKILHENHSYWYQSAEKWDELIKKIPSALKQAISDIKVGCKDKYSERKPAMDSSGKNYIYQNIKGKPKIPWNKEVKALLGSDLFAFNLYYEKK